MLQIEYTLRKAQELTHQVHLHRLIQVEVPDIPYTRSGKKVELAVARLVNGSSKADNRDALGNPEALDRIRERLVETGLLAR